VEQLDCTSLAHADCAAPNCFEQAEAAWSATHGPHHWRKAVSVELPVNRLQVVARSIVSMLNLNRD
jgi:hypothetical protein